MSVFIENVLFQWGEGSPSLEDKKVSVAHSFLALQSLLKASSFQNYKRFTFLNDSANRVVSRFYNEDNGSFQSVVELSHSLSFKAIGLKAKVLRHQKVFKMTTRSQINLFCRLMQRFNSYLQVENIQLAIDVETGEVVVKYSPIDYWANLTLPILKLVGAAAKKIGYFVAEQMIHIAECINQSFQWEIYSKDVKYLEKITSDAYETLKIRQLIAISHICFQEDGDAAKYARSKDLIGFLEQRMSMAVPTLKRNIVTGREMELYCLFVERDYFSSRPVSLKTFEGGFLQEFNTLFYNFMPRKLNEGENAFIFNTILVKNEHLIEATDTNCEGGFSKIQIAEMQIAYTESHNQAFQPPSSRKSAPKYVDPPVDPKKLTYLRKVIAVKVNKSKAEYEKIRHQKLVVQSFRTTSSPFIIKYYNCTQRAFKYRHCLLMDYLGPTTTLTQYCQINKNTISLHSKMQMLSYIANALIFLKSHSIVHMDLSGSNIVVVRDLMVKIIDFGEAYHPYVDAAKYAPGYTLPYCPPETFNEVKKFTSKSDVFSFGVIIYRLLFGHFLLNSTEVRDAYIHRSYLNRLLMAPERLVEEGYNTQMLLTLQLGLRCLCPWEEGRPQAYWVYVILSKVLFNLK